MATKQKTITSIADLIPDPRNARKHNPRNIGVIEDALRELGAGRSILIDASGEIIAGNGVVEAAAQAGIERVRVVESDGKEIIAVRRADLTGKLKRRMAIADNRAGELAGWDIEVLGELKAEDDTLLTGLFTGEELEDLLGDAGAIDQSGVDAEPQIDRAEELRVEWGVERGQLWQLGGHRLLCGDATSAEDVARLLQGEKPLIMVTDPPYGIEYNPEWRNEAAAAGKISFAARATGRVANDDRADWSAAYALFPGDVIYIWHAGVRSAEVQTSIERCGFKVRAQLIWNKSHMVISRGHYHGKHEPLFYAVRENATASWAGDRSQMTVWDVSNMQDDRTCHGTQKPVECMSRPIRNHGGKDDGVYDPFCGSGTTIIAAEQLGRRCFAMEILPGYVAVTLQRYKDATGKTPVRVEDN